MQVRRVLGAAVVAITVGGLASTTTWTAAAAPSHPGKPKWAAADRTGTVRLKGQVPLAVAKAAAGRPSAAALIGAHPARATLSLNFALPLRNRAGAGRADQDRGQDAPLPEPGRAVRAVLAARGPGDRAAALAHPARIHDHPRQPGPHRGRGLGHRPRRSSARSARPVNDYVRSAYTYHGVKVPAYRFYSNTASPRVPARLGVQSVSGLSDIDRFFTNQQLLPARSRNAAPRRPAPTASTPAPAATSRSTCARCTTSRDTGSTPPGRRSASPCGAPASGRPR